MTDSIIAMWFITCSGCGWYSFSATFGWSETTRLLSAAAATVAAILFIVVLSRPKRAGANDISADAKPERVPWTQREGP